MDSYDGDPQSPMSLHKYIYAVGDSVDRLDPSGHDSLDELMAAFTVASTVASLSNVLVAGVYSLYSGLPDAVGFGVYAAGGVGKSHTSVASPAPRWSTYLDCVKLPFTPGAVSRVRAQEAGVFAVWYWNFKKVGGVDPLGIIGTSAGGALLGYEGSGPGKPQGLLFGLSTNSDPSIFGIGGIETKFSSSPISEGEMSAQAVGAEAAFQLAGLYRFGVPINTGALAGIIVSGGAVSS
jgi:hypothetical protein